MGDSSPWKHKGLLGSWKLSQIPTWFCLKYFWHGIRIKFWGEFTLSDTPKLLRKNRKRSISLKKKVFESHYSLSACRVYVRKRLIYLYFSNGDLVFSPLSLSLFDFNCKSPARLQITKSYTLALSINFFDLATFWVYFWGF